MHRKTAGHSCNLLWEYLEKRLGKMLMHFRYTLYPLNCDLNGVRIAVAPLVYIQSKSPKKKKSITTISVCTRIIQTTTLLYMHVSMYVNCAEL